MQDDSLEKSSGVLWRRNRATNCEGPGLTGTYPGAVEHESARRSNNRLSAPVSARSLLPKFVFMFFFLSLFLRIVGEVALTDLPQFESCAAYNLTVDQDVDAVDANPKCS